MLRSLLLFGFCWVLAKAVAQDTFSLIAFDPATGQIVSAGGSCIDGNDIPGGAATISSVVAGVGVLHTQSYYSPVNQALGARLLALGLSAKLILDSLIGADVAFTPMFRQYAIMSRVAGKAEFAAYTGQACQQWAGHIIGENYVLAGNILLDSTVLRRMEAGLLAARKTGEDVTHQAAAALEAVAFPGADRRCLRAGISCRSAFLRLSDPGDAPSKLSLDLKVEFPLAGEDPILILLRNLKTRTE